MWDRETQPKKLFTFASGGWVLLLTAALGVVIVVITVIPALQRLRNRPPGDGSNPATYGFALEPNLVGPDAIVPGQLHRDMMPPLVEPPVMAGSAVEPYNREMRGKYVVPTDRVVGVVVGSEARAYPLLVLSVHEIVNDTLGGVPIVVTYNPLCDSVVVFDRRVAGETLTFGTSGLLYESNMLMYDRRAVPATASSADGVADLAGAAAPAAPLESLWSQLQARAITGPAAAAERTLDMRPAVLTQWSDWLALHPETTVLDPEVDLLDRYKGTNYDRYFISRDILFPLTNPPPADGPRPKERCVVVRAGGVERVYTVASIAGRADADGRWADDVGGVRIEFLSLKSPEVVRVTDAEGHAVMSIPCLWFGWYASHPETTVPAS